MPVTDKRLLDTSTLPRVPEGFTRMAVVPVRDRMVQGPKSFTIYHFMPWALIENRDIEDMQTISVTKGCACNGNQRRMPLFATEDDILSGRVVPDW
jgi:hypothetical protein